jgi:prophage regulatory protein
LTENLLRLVDIGQLLGISKQRAHQLSKRRRFPTPAATYARGRLWRQSDVERWAHDYRGGAARWGKRSGS